MKLGNLEINLQELAEFIVDAKKHCYAGNGTENILEDGSKQLTFQKGDFHYTDNYYGSSQAPGTEIVRWQRPNGQWIWKMSYSGGMLPKYWGDKELTKKTFTFLKEVLLQITPGNPFRGPENCYFERGDLVYYAKTEGDISRFSGKETISKKNKDKTGLDIIFSQDYIGELPIK